MKQKNSPRAQTARLTSFGPVLVVPNLPTLSLLHISQGLGVGAATVVGCQVVVADTVRDYHGLPRGISYH